MAWVHIMSIYVCFIRTKTYNKYNVDTVLPQICDASVTALAQWDLHAHVQHRPVDYKIELT